MCSNKDLNSIDDQFKDLVEYLDYCLENHKTATYLEVANAISIPAPRRIGQLTELLEALMEYDQKHRFPLRSALVVSRIGASLPAEGFFLKAQSLGLMRTMTSAEFHQQCLSQLFTSPLHR